MLRPIRNILIKIAYQSKIAVGENKATFMQTYEIAGQNYRNCVGIKKYNGKIIFSN
jgi:hypothetical protein